MAKVPITDSTNLKSLIQELRNIFEDDQVDVERVTKLLRSYKSNPEDWLKYTKFDPYRQVFFYITVREVLSDKNSEI